MKKTEFTSFMISLGLSLEIDDNLRRITEKIKLLHQLRREDTLIKVKDLLSKVDYDIDSVIYDVLPDDE